MRRPTLFGRFRDSTRAMAAVEFAIALPVLLTLMMLGTQVVNYVNAVRKVELLASSMSEMISQKAPPTGSTTATVNQLDLHFSYDSALVIFPYLMADGPRQGVAWWQDIYIDYASVQFTKIAGTTCPSTGDQSPCYVANVVWTSTGTTGGNQRVCTLPQTAMNNTAAPTNTSIPRSIFGAGSIIVVDVVFTYHPTFAASVMPSLRIARSVYVQPRYATLINFDTTNNDGIATKCPGY